jgi:molybdopterin converting factor small subunit
MHGILRQYIKNQDSLELEVEKEATPLDLLKILKIDHRELWLVVVNNQTVHLDYVFTDQDIVDFIPPIGGGVEADPDRFSPTNASYGERVITDETD